jgi:hypothetical protein
MMPGKADNAQQTGEAMRKRQPPQTVPLELTSQQPLQPLTVGVQRAIASPSQVTPPDLLAMQHVAGNRATTRLIQTKLMVGPAGDRYEQEADRVAEQVLSGPVPQRSEDAKGVGGQLPVQRQEDEEEVQTKPSAPSGGSRSGEAGGFQVGGPIEGRLAANKGSGSPLPEETRSYMEERFGADFGQVRLHTDSEAAQMNQDLSAQAFTQGQDIYLGAGKFSPDTDTGRHLLAHELTHVIQQGGAQVQRKDNRPAAQLQQLNERPTVTADSGLSSKIQRSLGFDPTNWSDTHQIMWVKGQDHPDHDNVLNFKGGGGSRLWVKTDESVAEANAAANLVTSAAQIRGAKGPGGGAWKLSTPQIRAATPADRTAMAGKLGKLKPNATRAEKAQLRSALLTSPDVHISTHAGGEMGDNPVPEAQEPWIHDPGFRKALGYTGFLDLIMANFDRIMGMVGPQNWKVERPNATLHLIDNLYRAGGFNLPFEEWSLNSWIVMARARNWAGIRTQLLGYWETDPQFQLIPPAQQGPWANDFMAGMQEAYGDLDAVRHALEAGGPPDAKRAILLQRISYLRGWVMAGPRAPRWKSARPGGGT